MTAKRRSQIAAVLAVGALALTGCGNDESPATVAGDPETSSSETTEQQTDEPAPSESTSTAEPSADASPTGAPHTGKVKPAKRRSENIVLRKPANGAVVSGKLRAAGRANSPEANVPWRLKNADGKVVKKGFATAEGWMDRLYPWRTTVNVRKLPPGAYTFVAMTDDPSGGAEGKGVERVWAHITIQ